MRVDPNCKSRKMKGKWLIAQNKKLDVANKKSGSTLKPKILLLWKLTHNLYVISKPRITTLIDQKFSHNVFPYIIVSSVNCRRSNPKFSLTLKGWKLDKEQSFFIRPDMPSTTIMKRNGNNRSSWWKLLLTWNSIWSKSKESKHLTNWFIWLSLI